MLYVNTMGDCLSQVVEYCLAPAHRLVYVKPVSPQTPRFPGSWDDEVQRFRECNVDASSAYDKRDEVR